MDVRHSEKSIPRDNCSASLGKPYDACQVIPKSYPGFAVASRGLRGLPSDAKQ